MAGVQVEPGSALAQEIQRVVQPKLMENGWATEENDTTLSEYVTMMLVNGKDLHGVVQELGGDLLGIGEDDPAVAVFAQWLFEQVRAMTAPQQPQPPTDDAQMQQDAQLNQTVEDSQMDDAALPATDAIPSGPKAMRDGAGPGRGRGRRMLGQLNSHLNREQQLPDPLRRIKGAASGNTGRINAHANREPPKGPRSQNAANGMQRMMNGGAKRGGNMGMNAMMQPGGNAMMNTQDQLAFLKMMEDQARLMAQALQGGQPNGGKSMFDRVDKRPNGHLKRPRNPDSQNGDAASSGMDVDSEGNKKSPFDSVCRYNAQCTNASCPFAHQSPAAPPGQTIDMTDTCSFGAACENRKCAGRHPSPGQRAQHLKQEVECKFYPNCTNPNCPFKHPDMPMCRNGADCSVPGCKFTHSKIMCRYTPCTKPFCPFKHVEGQKGVFKDKVWQAGDGVPTDLEGEGGGTAHRLAGFSSEGQEELILPGQQEQQNGGEEVSQLQHETQIGT